MVTLDTVLDAPEQETFVEPQKAIEAFRKVRDFFPRDDYLYRSISTLAQQLGDVVSVHSVYESLRGRRKRIRKTIEEAVLELEQQIQSDHVHDKNILPVNRREARTLIKSIRPMVAELFDWFQFKSYRAMAKHIRDQVTTRDMPISLAYIEYLLHGNVLVIPTNEALKVAQEISRMLDNARRRMPDRVNIAYLIRSKSSDTASEPLAVFISRALKKFVGNDYKTDRVAVYQALKEPRRAEQLDSLVREVSKDYGFPSLTLAYKYLFDFLDIRLRKRTGVKMPMHVNQKLFALAKVLQIAKNKYGQIRVESSYLVVQPKEYFKPIEGLKARGFDDTLLAAILSRALMVSKDNAHSKYVTARKHYVTATKYQTLEELDDRLRDTIAVDSSNPQMDGKVYEQFALAYRQVRGPVIVNVGKRTKLDTDVFTGIRNAVHYFGQEVYLYSTFKLQPKVDGYSPFKDFLKMFVDKPIRTSK